MPLEGKTVIVTGSTQGIGYAVAAAALEQRANVVINSRKQENIDEALEHLMKISETVMGVAADLRVEKDVNLMVGKAVNRFGGVDVLINNAGGTFHQPVEGLSLNGWRAVVETNLTSAFLCSKAVRHSMRSRGGGRIINVASTAAIHPFPTGAHYAAAKAGMVSLTRTLAVEWGGQGIAVNCVAPGSILTGKSSFKDDEVRAAVEAATPRGRVGTPEEVAEVLLCVAGLETTFLTGEVIIMDGAQSHLYHRRAERPRSA